MTAIKNLIGDVVVNQSGKTFSTQSLFDGDVANPVLGLYFSAHWCPPCREFTPVLANFYTKFKSTSDGQRFEIVFVSSDHDEKAYTQYMHEMPWLALPYHDRECKAKLSKRFQVQGIPLLILVDATTGKMITNAGRKCVLTDPEGSEFPWIPEPLSDILSHGKLLKGTVEFDSKKVLTGHVKGLYFSAQWCPPCRTFTPDLLKAYESLKARGCNFEVVYVSWDKSPEVFRDYFATMPWYAIPFQDPRVMKLAKHFNVKGIPVLILLNANDEVITLDGRTVISKDPEGLRFPWITSAVEELSENNANMLNEATCIVLFTGGDNELLSKALPSLTDAARHYSEEQQKSLETANPLPHLNFFYEGPTSTEVADQLKTFVFGNGLLGLEPPSKCVAILDIPEQRVYSRDNDAATNVVTDSLSLRRLLEDFASDKLAFVPLQHHYADTDMIM